MSAVESAKACNGHINSHDDEALLIVMLGIENDGKENNGSENAYDTIIEDTEESSELSISV